MAFLVKLNMISPPMPDNCNNLQYCSGYADNPSEIMYSQKVDTEPEEDYKTCNMDTGRDCLTVLSIQRFRVRAMTWKGKDHSRKDELGSR